MTFSTFHFLFSHELAWRQAVELSRCSIFCLSFSQRVAKMCIALLILPLYTTMWLALFEHLFFWTSEQNNIFSSSEEGFYLLLECVSFLKPGLTPKLFCGFTCLLKTADSNSFVLSSQVFKSKKENPQKLTQLSLRSHP